MRKLFIAFAAIIFSAVNLSAGEISYELNQPFENIMLKLSVPGADKIIVEKSRSKLQSKKLQSFGIALSLKGFGILMKYDTLIKREDGKNLKFKEVVIFYEGETVIKTKLVSKGDPLNKYFLITTIKKVGNKTRIDHKIDIEYNGKTSGFRYAIVRRIALARVENGIREVVQEPRPE